MCKKKFLILFFLLTNALNANDNSISITYSNSLFKEELIPIQNYNNNGLQLSKSILLADYYHKKNNFKFFTSYYFSNDEFHLHNFGTLIFVKNTYLNIGKAPLYRFSEYDFTLSDNAKPFLKFEFGNKEKIENEFFKFEYYFLLGKLNSQNKHLFDQDYQTQRIDKYIDAPYFHSKSFNFTFELNRQNEIDIGFTHGAMFGGTILRGDNKISPRNNLRALGDVIILRTNTYQNYDINGEGNHVGSWDFQYRSKGNFNFFFSKMFDDKSGFLFKNNFDGVIGINSLKKNNFNLLYVQTTNQSGEKHPPGIDSYYWHHVYTYGWRSNGFSLGLPFILPNNNRKKIFKIGLSNDKNLSFNIFRINEFNYYGNKGDESGININHNEINKKTMYFILNYTHALKGVNINHSLGFEKTRNDNIDINNVSFLIKLTKEIQF